MKWRKASEDLPVKGKPVLVSSKHGSCEVLYRWDGEWLTVAGDDSPRIVPAYWTYNLTALPEYEKWRAVKDSENS